MKECRNYLSKIKEEETKGGPAGWLTAALHPAIIPFPLGGTGNSF